MRPLYLDVNKSIGNQARKIIVGCPWEPRCSIVTFRQEYVANFMGYSNSTGYKCILLDKEVVR